MKAVKMIAFLQVIIPIPIKLLSVIGPLLVAERKTGVAMFAELNW